MVRKAALIFALCLAGSVGAKAPTQRAAVDRAKAELVEDADGALTDALRADPKFLADRGMSNTLGRSIALWTMLQFVSADCHDLGGDQLEALLLDAAVGFGDQGQGLQHTVLAAKQSGALEGYTSAHRASYCRAHVPAARELLFERFNVS